MVSKKVAAIIKRTPDFPPDLLPTAKFEPRMLPIRKKAGDEPIRVDLLWGSHEDAGDIDVLYLCEHLASKGRACHVNNGVHGKVNKDGKFEFVWKNDGEE